ncbi:MAG: B12-binding domain-containing radical SAM protein [Caldisericaceae bacterium]|nr:B12-binding domain-containing radical SAM protein [Caldisericaceae bacterium]
MSYRLLLINPWIYDFTAYDLWSKPLGLLYLGSFLRSQGFEISFIDCLDKYAAGQKVKVKKYGVGNLPRTIVEKPAILKHIPRHYARYGIPEEHFIKQLKEHQEVDAVLVTSIMTYWYPGVKKVVELVRKYLPDKPVILGGIYASLCPEHAKEVIQPDYIITGPGEIKVLKLLADLFSIPFNSFKIPATLDDYPYPAFDLLNHPDYFIVMTSRGCPYDCSFCAQKRIAMRFTQRNPERVVEEINDQYRRFRLRDFAFYDDALFIAKQKHIEVILQKLLQKRMPLRLHTPNGLFVKYVDRFLAQLMFETNFKTIRLSFETANADRWSDMYSKVSNQAMIEAVEHLKAAGYRAKDLEAYVIMGLPGQTLEEIIASIIFVNNLGVQVRLASFSPIPGTREFERAVKMGLIEPDIDPLLTNKSIFPLSNDKISYDTFRKIRKFANILNEAAKNELTMFGDESLGLAVKRVVRDMQ